MIIPQIYPFSKHWRALLPAPPATTQRNAKRKLLIVDNDATTRHLLHLTFKHEPYNVQEAADDEVALSVCRNMRPDLILLHLEFSLSKGIALLRQIRQVNQTAIILVVSTLSRQAWIADVIANGADGFIPNPFGLAEMRQLVAHQLEGYPQSTI